MRVPYSLVLVGAVLCASATYAMPTDPPQAVPPNATAAAPAAATTVAVTTPEEQKAKDLAIMVQRAKDAGFKPEKHRGETWYCKKSIPVATRLPVKQCANEAGLLVLLDRAQETKDSMKIMNYTPGIKDQPAAK